MRYEDATRGKRVCHPQYGYGIVSAQDYYSTIKIQVKFDLHPRQIIEVNAVDLRPLVRR